VADLVLVRPQSLCPEPDYTLSFATDADGDQVFIHADAKGLDARILSLTDIRRKLDENVCEHDHHELR
jgi:hypothetical protein